MDEKSKRKGGKRLGAGRKKTVARAVSIRVPQDVADILENVTHPSAWICEAIRMKASHDKTLM